MLNLFQHLSYITPPQSSPSREEEQFRKYRCGFTLAEVLITLVIIGVIAAITVPTLITKYQKEQTVTRLKKAYSALSQTTSKAIADYGPVKTWDIGEDGSPEASKEFANKYLVPYLNVMRNCENEADGPCRFQRKTRAGSNYILNERYARFFLNDGTLIGVYIYNSEAHETRALVYIDINGQKAPNLVGKDYFELSYNLITPSDSTVQGKFMPIGINKSREEIIQNDCNRVNSGWHCFALILKDGWKISDDYPW